MKVCFVCSEYPPGPHGGIGTMTQVLGRSLVKHGHEVRVIGVYPLDYPAPDFEEDLGVQVWRMRDSQHAASWIVSRYQLYRQLLNWARAGQVHIIEVPDYQGWAAGWGGLNVPVVVRLHGSVTYFAAELQQSIDRVSYWLERASLRRADAVCSVCRYTSSMTQQRFKLALDCSTVLYNPVEFPPELPSTPRAANRVVFSGTLTGKKGVVSLIKAWPIVVKANPNAELHIFGKDGRSEDGRSMQAFLSSLLNGARSSVRFHGHVSRRKLFETYQSSGVAVFPSRVEAFAIAPLEAMAHGCPTIYSNRGSGPELLENGREGLLIDPDQPEQIAEAIRRVQADPLFAKRLGEAGRARVKHHFSIEDLTEQNLTFYDRCMAVFLSGRSIADRTC